MKGEEKVMKQKKKEDEREKEKEEKEEKLDDEEHDDEEEEEKVEEDEEEGGGLAWSTGYWTLDTWIVHCTLDTRDTPNGCSEEITGRGILATRMEEEEED